MVACADHVAAASSQYAAGSAWTWFSALRDARVELLDYAGGKLPMQLVRGLHDALIEPETGAANGQPPAASRAAASPTNGTSSS